jgi:glycerol-3-phosphate acyltransferase PlsY
MTINLLIGLIFSYLIGSIPFGYLIVKLTTGEDIRQIQSGRTGGTNTMRAAGLWAGFLTATFDITKGAFSVQLGRELLNISNPWLLILLPIAVIIGNNYSLYLLSKTENNRLKFGGGAGGAACLGGSIGLWWPSGVIIVIIAICIFYFVGYASVTTISIALTSIMVFSIAAINGIFPWAYAVYGVLAEILLLISLRPNIQNLMQGTERLHGYRANKLNQSHN